MANYSYKINSKFRICHILLVLIIIGTSLNTKVEMILTLPMILHIIIITAITISELLIKNNISALINNLHMLIIITS